MSCHSLWPLVGDSSQLQGWSAKQRFFLSQTPTADLHFRSPRSQTRPHRTLVLYFLLLIFVPRQNFFNRGQIIHQSKTRGQAPLALWRLPTHWPCPSFQSIRTHHMPHAHRFDLFVRCTLGLSARSLPLQSDPFRPQTRAPSPNFWGLRRIWDATQASPWLVCSLQFFFSSIKVEDVVGFLPTTTASSLISWTPIYTPVSSGDVPVFLFFTAFFTYIVPFCSDLPRFKPTLGSARPVAENNSDQFLQRVFEVGCESCRIITLPSSSSSVTSTYVSCGSSSIKAFGIDSGTVANTSERKPRSKRNYFSSGNASWRLYRKLFKISSLRFSNI